MSSLRVAASAADKLAEYLAEEAKLKNDILKAQARREHAEAEKAEADAALTKARAERMNRPQTASTDDMKKTLHDVLNNDE